MELEERVKQLEERFNHLLMLYMETMGRQDTRVYDLVNARVNYELEKHNAKHSNSSGKA